MGVDKDTDRTSIDTDLRLSFRDSWEFRAFLEELIPLVENMKNDEQALKILKPCSKDMISRAEKIGKLAQFLETGLKQKPIDQEETLQKAFMYLGLFEVSITNLLDNILMIYIANHHDFYLNQNSCYASNFHSLDFASLSEKLKFLKQHEFNINLKQLKEIRDKIAHMDFEVMPKGIIIVKEKKYYVSKEIIHLAMLIMFLQQLLIDCGFVKLIKNL